MMARPIPTVPADLKSARIAVLMGGISSEREVSLVSGAAVFSALTDAGYTVRGIDVGADVAALIAELTDHGTDLVFNALHGRYGEDGCIQGLLDLMGLPYTHSGRLASALAMDKNAAKARFEGAGLTVVPHSVTTREAACSRDALPRPFVIKPVEDGSSVGVNIVFDGDALPPMPNTAEQKAELVMVEAYVPGRELTVAVIGDKALAVTEILTVRGFYDYDAKYADGGSRHVIPADIPEELAARAMAAAVTAHKCLGCSGVSRSDFRYDPATDRLVVLETNTQPGLTPTSLVPEQAAHVGIAFLDLILLMLREASCVR